MKLGPYLYHLNTFNIPNNKGVNEWGGGGGGGGATIKPLENAMKLISTLTSSKTVLENAKEMEIFSLPSITIKL